MQEIDSFLTRRERQIMDILFARGSSTAAELVEAIPDAPANSTIRTLLRVLETKGHVMHTEVGRVFHYAPTQPLETARRSAVRHLVDTFFEGSVEGVVAAILKVRRTPLSQDEAVRIARMIEDSARKGR